MFTKLKNLSLMTKLLYLLAIIVFLLWVIPQMKAYYTNINKYEKNLQALENISSNYGLELHTKKFSKALFQQNSELLFEKVTVEDSSNNTYLVNIKLKKEDLKSFYTFIETISLRYYVEVAENLKFKIDDDFINTTMILKMIEG